MSTNYELLLRATVAVAFGFVSQLSLRAQSNYATPYTFATLAGSAGNSGSVDGTGSAARFSTPKGIAVDGSGNIFVADQGNHTIRKISSAGVVSTFAGLAGSQGSTDGVGSDARFNGPTGVAVDTAGNVYVADSNNNTIRKITTSGVVTTLAGEAPTFANNWGYPYFVNATGSAARFSGVRGLAVDSAGDVYVADVGNRMIRKVTAAGVVTTLAGNQRYGLALPANGTGSEVVFNGPVYVAVDGTGNVFLTDPSCVRKITPGGVVTTYAGMINNGGDADGPAASATFASPAGLALDSTGNFFLADGRHTIRKISVDGVVSTVAGMSSLAASADGSGSSARFSTPDGVAVDASGKIYVVDSGNSTIRVGMPGPIRPLVTLGDFSRDGQSDILWQNLETGLRGYWTMNGTSDTGDFVSFCTVSTEWTIAATADFNGDGKLDLLWRNHASGTVGIWLLDGATQVGGFITLGSMDPPWEIAGVGDFNGDGKPDVVWQHSIDGRRGVWLLDDTVHDGTFSTFATVSPSWVISLVADFNGDGKPDLLWTDTTTGLRGFWTMNARTQQNGFIVLANVPTEWVLAQAGDFNADGKTDIVWSNSRTGQRGIWLMNGTEPASAYIGMPTVPVEWRLGNVDHKGKGVAVAGDFSGDGRSDILWQNQVTGARGYWVMNGTAYSGVFDGVGFEGKSLDWSIAGMADFNSDGHLDLLWRNRTTGAVGLALRRGVPEPDPLIDLGSMGSGWEIAGAGDFNADGKPDIVWQNSTDGRRGVWRLNGLTHDGNFTVFGTVTPNWVISLVADFNGDGKPDLLWTNTQSGLRGFWLMDGLNQQGAFVVLATVPPEWILSQTGDFNGDGKTDIVWSNTSSVQRGIWLLNGTAPASDFLALPTVPSEWRLGPSN